MTITKSYLKDLTYKVTGAVIEVHKHLGSGLLESVYHKCLKQELKERKIKFKSELIVPVYYKGLDLETELRCDLFIENIFSVELKATDGISPIHEAQLLTLLTYIKKDKNFC